MREQFVYVATPLGQMALAGTATHITRLAFCPADWTRQLEEKTSPLLEEARLQLQAYFAGKRRHFDLPLRPAGTPFQQTVFAALRQIPYAQTRSYREIACAVGNPRAARAIGSANHVNPIAILIPCHRVIAADGSWGGYAKGVTKKIFLVNLEKSYQPAA